MLIGIYFGTADSRRYKFVTNCGFERRLRRREVIDWSISCNFGEDRSCRSSSKVELLDWVSWREGVGVRSGGNFEDVGGGGDLGEDRRKDAIYRNRTGQSREEAG